MMKEKVFIVGDVHGEYALLEKLLSHWREEEEDLIFLGDLGDRGPDSKSCFLAVMELVKAGRAVCISGNHEQMLLQWLRQPEEGLALYLSNGGQETLESLFHAGILSEMSPSEVAQKVQQTYPDLIEFLEGLPFYHETPVCLCVHAGVNLDLDDWRETSQRDFVWMRGEFFHHEKRLDKLIVFGHTPVQALYLDETKTHIWYQNGKVNIDGGAVYGGSLHGLVVSNHGIEADYQVYHPQHKWEK